MPLTTPKGRSCVRAYKRWKRARRTSIARVTLTGEIVLPEWVLKLMAGTSSQRGVRRAEGSNGGSNGECSEAIIHSASVWKDMIGRGERGGGLSELTGAEGFAPLVAARIDGR